MMGFASLNPSYALGEPKDVDGRDKPGHEATALTLTPAVIVRAGGRSSRRRAADVYWMPRLCGA